MVSKSQEVLPPYLQIVSFVTFLGLWTNTGRQVLLVDKPISTENEIRDRNLKILSLEPIPCTDVNKPTGPTNITRCQPLYTNALPSKSGSNH
jgi:hypothetical protein